MFIENLCVQVSCTIFFLYVYYIMNIGHLSIQPPILDNDDTLKPPILDTPKPSKSKTKSKSKSKANTQWEPETVLEPEHEPETVLEPEHEPETVLEPEPIDDGYLPKLEPIVPLSMNKETKVVDLQVSKPITIECTRPWYILCQKFYKNCPVFSTFDSSSKLLDQRYKRGELNHIRWMNGVPTIYTTFDSFSSLDAKRKQLNQAWDNNIYGQYIQEHHL